MELLKKMYGPSREEIWKQLSQEMQASFVKNESGSRNRIIAKVDEWTVTMDTHIIHTQHDRIEFVRIRAPFYNNDGFRFSVYRGGIFDSIGKLFGMQDIHTGYPEFDEPFIIQSNSEEKIKQLFGNHKIRGLMKKQNSIHLQVKDDDGYFKDHFPVTADELFLLSEANPTNEEKVRALYDLFAEVLHQLCHIGSAYESDPNIRLS